jgi:TetR/AcrR family transcriptional repressor of nem operon
MARPREFDEDEVREAIMHVFWERGYEGTTIQDLVAATGLLKGSLYGAFGDKQVMFLTALAHYDQTHIQAGVDMLRGEGGMVEKIARMFDLVVESIKTDVYAGGCLLCNASIEMATVDKNVQKAVQAQISRLQVSVISVLKNEIPGAAEAEKLSGFVLGSYFGTRVLAKAGMPIQTIIDTKEQCLGRLMQAT